MPQPPFLVSKPRSGWRNWALASEGGRHRPAASIDSDAAQKTGKLVRLPRCPSILRTAARENRRSGLEAEAQVKLYFPRVVDLAFKSAPIRLIAEEFALGANEGIVQLVMVENVREHGAKLRGETFGNLDVLLEAEVHVPEGLAAEVAGPAVVTIVDAQNGVAEAVIDRSRILVQLGPVTVRSIDSASTYRVIVSRAAEATFAGVDAVVKRVQASP